MEGYALFAGVERFQTNRGPLTGLRSGISLMEASRTPSDARDTKDGRTVLIYTGPDGGRPTHLGVS